ncbi:MAG: hypothetical protein EB134_00200 [Actinobacteria bacterium]|nr:hypothetical protein [Actinomycetota bacterium]
MKNINLRKSLVALSTTALIAGLAVAIPTAARADGPTCSEVAAATKYSELNTVHAIHNYVLVSINLAQSMKLQCQRSSMEL